LLAPFYHRAEAAPREDRAMTLATVLIPTHDHADTLPLAVASARAQRGVELEILVVGDGVPDRTRELVAALQRDEPRLRYFDRPKGERHGERHRHEALAAARGDFVAYLADDDLWLPGHLAALDAALRDADLAHTIAVSADPAGALSVALADVAVPGYLDRLRANQGGFGLSCAGHTLAAYRRLPEGWCPAPKTIATDAWMWIQLLEQPGLRAASVPRATVFRLPSPERRGVPPPERAAEMERWWRWLGAPDGEQRFRDAVIEALARERVGQLDALRRRVDEEVAEVARLRGVLAGLEAERPGAGAGASDAPWRRAAHAVLHRLRRLRGAPGGGASA